jgi:hypothetical protein
VPCRPGAYVVLRLSAAEPAFVQSSPAGHFQGGDPTVSVERLQREWLAGARVLYIGKADFRKRRRPVEALRNRLDEYAR